MSCQSSSMVETPAKIEVLVDSITAINTPSFSKEDSLIINYLSRKMMDLATLKEKMKAGEPVKIVCYGNSITYGFQVNARGQVDKPYPQELERMLRKQYANEGIVVVNEGHNGWRSDQAAQQVGYTVIPHNPHLAIVMFGINDAYSKFTLAFYKRQITYLVKYLKKNKISVLLLSPTPISTPQNTLVGEYSEVLSVVAEEQAVAFFDLHQQMQKRIEGSEIPIEEILPDEVHLGAAYYKWIAEAVTNYWRRIK